MTETETADVRDSACKLSSAVSGLRKPSTVLEVEQGLFTYLLPLMSRLIRSVPTASTMAKMPEKNRASLVCT
jgi:hypothetical protein